MFKLILLEDARRFLKKLPPQVMKKIIYNIDRVVGGEINAELFNNSSLIFPVPKRPWQ